MNTPCPPHRWPVPRGGPLEFIDVVYEYLYPVRHEYLQHINNPRIGTQSRISFLLSAVITMLSTWGNRFSYWMDLYPAILDSIIYCAGSFHNYRCLVSRFLHEMIHWYLKDNISLAWCINPQRFQELTLDCSDEHLVGLDYAVIVNKRTRIFLWLDLCERSHDKDPIII